MEVPGGAPANSQSTIHTPPCFCYVAAALSSHGITRVDFSCWHSNSSLGLLLQRQDELEKISSCNSGLSGNVLWSLVEGFYLGTRTSRPRKPKVEGQEAHILQVGRSGGAPLSFFDLFIPGSVSINFCKSQAWDGIPVQVIYLGMLARCRREEIRIGQGKSLDKDGF